MKHALARVWKILNMPKNMQLFIARATNDEFLIGVTVVILTKKDEVLLVKHTYRQTPWSLPGGYLQKGEHPRQGAAREVLEETGFTVKIEKIIKTDSPDETARLDMSCVGKFIKGKFTASPEVIEYGFFRFEKMPFIGAKQKKLIKRVLEEDTTYFKPKNYMSRVLDFFHPQK